MLFQVFVTVKPNMKNMGLLYADIIQFLVQAIENSSIILIFIHFLSLTCHIILLVNFGMTIMNIKSYIKFNIFFNIFII
jgi:hypothetical protein